MPIEFVCVNCQARYEFSDDLAGTAVKCRECGARCRVGPAAPEPRSPAAPVRAAAAPIPDEPASFRAALSAAEGINQVVQSLVAVGVVGCVILLISGLATRHAVEAIVVVVLAGAQMYFASVGARLVVSLVQVFVGVAKDARAVRKTLCREQAGP